MEYKSNTATQIQTTDEKTDIKQTGEQAGTGGAVQGETDHACDERFTRNREMIARAHAGDDKALELIVTENIPLVRSIAYRFRDRGCELDDLMQIGTLGMIKAVRSFDANRGTAFSTYAVPLIVGEIRRHLRDDGLIKVSRSFKRIGVIIMREKSRIMTEEGRDAGILELASLAGVSVEEAAMAIDAVSPVASLSDCAYGENSQTFGDIIPDRDESDELERLNDKIALGQAISRMPEEWRRIVLLRYYRNMTQTQVASILGMTQVKVSREEKKIMSFLRGELLGRGINA